MGVVIMAAVGIVVVFCVFVLVYASRYTKVGPNEVLVISGRRRRMIGPDGTAQTVGYRIVKGGGAFVWPVFEKAETLSLELLTLDIKLPEVYTTTGVPVVVDGVAQIKVKGEDISIATAAEQFLSKTRGEVMPIAHQTLEGHLRAILGIMTVEDLYKNREAFAQRVQEVAATDLANMGLQIVSFTLRDIKDNQGYLEALGKPRIAEVRRDALIAQAEADRDATIKSAEARRAGEEAKFQAESQIAMARRDFEMKQADYQAAVNQRKAETDLSYDLAKYKVSQAVKREEMQVSVVEKEKLIDLQEKEILRREKELQATVHKSADAEKYRIETLAEAYRLKVQTEAAGEGEAKRVVGFGEAEAQKARGLAEAEVIRAKGEADAAAMSRKAEAWDVYNQAAILQLFIERMPEIAKAMAEPLTRMEKMVVISNGGNGSAGAAKITQDVTAMMAQLPEVLKTLSGIDITQWLQFLPGPGQRTSAHAEP
jgi:flotillin